MMKNGKRPTKNQKIAIKSCGLNPENWLVTKNMNEEMHIIHRNTNSKRVIPI